MSSATAGINISRAADTILLKTIHYAIGQGTLRVGGRASRTLNAHLAHLG